MHKKIVNDTKLITLTEIVIYVSITVCFTKMYADELFRHCFCFALWTLSISPFIKHSIRITKFWLWLTSVWHPGILGKSVQIWFLQDSYQDCQHRLVDEDYVVKLKVKPTKTNLGFSSSESLISQFYALSVIAVCTNIMIWHYKVVLFSFFPEFHCTYQWKWLLLSLFSNLDAAESLQIVQLVLMVIMMSLTWLFSLLRQPAWVSAWSSDKHHHLLVHAVYVTLCQHLPPTDCVTSNHDLTRYHEVNQANVKCHYNNGQIHETKTRNSKSD